jgi:hypothetical protein
VGFVYSAPTALVFVGVATLPRAVGESVFAALSPVVFATAASLLATSITWSHYVAFLFVPLALRHPRLHPLWRCSRSLHPGGAI